MRQHPTQTQILSRLHSLTLPKPKSNHSKPFTTKQDLATLLQSCPPTQSHRSDLRTLHSRLLTSGYTSDVFLTNILLNSYSKSGLIIDARKVFDRMTQKNLISWSTVISMYAQGCLPEEAFGLFSCFRRSVSEGPNEFVIASVFRACGQLRDVGFGTQVHGLVVRAGFRSDVYVGTSLVGLYTKVGRMDDATLVFDELPVRNSVTWTAIIVGYSQVGRSDISLCFFNRMMETGLRPDKFVISSVMSACASLCSYHGGRQVHGYLYRNGVELDVSVNNVFVDFYSKCCRLKTARDLFDRMPLRNLVSWTTMIAGYMQNSCDFEAIKLFAEMSWLGWLPDAFACTTVMTSCGSLMALHQGKQVHAYVIKVDLEIDEYVKNGLVDMYAKCDSLVDARIVFDFMDKHNTVSYNAIIEGYASQENIVESVRLFNRMRSRSVCPSLLTFVSLLGVSSSKGDANISKQVHGLLIKSGESLDLYSGSALVDVYSKCSCINEARIVFEEMEDRDLVVWNAMILGYVKNEEGEKALNLYKELSLTRTKHNEFTFVALITTASNLASLLHGLQFHSQIIKAGVEFDPHVSNALVDMYAKCGSIKDARKVFDGTSGKDTICWNSLICRYADHGHAEEALKLFRQMQQLEILPTSVTFLGVLSACSHVGLVDAGLLHFNSMKAVFEIEPGMEHYACVVGILGRAGRLNEAKEFIEQMPVEPSAIIWRSFLGACKVFGNVALGKYAAKMAILMEPKDSGSYILLSNIFASKGLWGEVEKLRNKMEDSGVVKEPGHSWIELKNEAHLFLSRDKRHEDVNLINSTLDGLTKLIGEVGHNINESDIASVIV